MASEKQIQKVLYDGISYFSKDETIHVYECKKCHKLDPVPGFVIGEQLGFLKFIKAKKSYEMENVHIAVVHLSQSKPLKISRLFVVQYYIKYCFFYLFIKKRTFLINKKIANA